MSKTIKIKITNDTHKQLEAMRRGSDEAVTVEFLATTMVEKFVQMAVEEMRQSSHDTPADWLNYIDGEGDRKEIELLKIQRPLFPPNDDSAPALLYNYDKSFEAEIPFSVVKDLFKEFEPKIYAYMLHDPESGQVTFMDYASEQEW